MDQARYQRIKAVLMEALDCPPEAREALLAERCGDDQDLRAAVDELLAQEISDDFLATNALALAGGEETELTGQLGRIRISHLLARGGMGEVYAGEDELLGRPVAVKILNAGMRLSARRRSAFLSEAKLLSGLQHPHVCQVHDFFTDEDRDVLVLELINGPTLREALDGGAVDNPLELARQIAVALAAAHERGIAHRDLKPENVMLDDSGQAKVLDFGLASSTEGSGDGAATLGGTPGYMAPEQAEGQTVNLAADLWSFGVLLLELLGRGDPQTRAQAQRLAEEAKAHNLNLPPLPRAETTLLRRLLQFDPGLRPSARETAEAIERIQGRPVRRLRAAAVALALGLSVLAGWKYTSDLQRERAEAVAARNDAEALVEFMLDDLNAGLRGVGRVDLLESVADRVVDYYGRLDPVRVAATRGQSAMALLRVAEVYDARGNRRRALELMDEVIPIAAALHDADPEDELVAWRLGTLQSFRGDLLKVLGEFEAAKAPTGRAVALGRGLTAGSAPGEGPETHPNAAERWGLLLRSLYLLADAYHRVAENEQAVLLLDEAASLAEPAAEQQPALGSHLADIYFKRCDTYYDMALGSKAVSACRAVFELDRQLLADDPDNFGKKKFFTLDHITLSRALRANGEFDEALDIAMRGLELNRENLRFEPDDADARNEVATALITVGSALKEIDRKQEAMTYFTEALAIAREVAEGNEEIYTLNNLALALLNVGLVEEGREVATDLLGRGFRRRELMEACVEYRVPACLKEAANAH